MNKNIIITDLYWDNIYLKIKLYGDNLDSYRYFISDFCNHMYPIDLVESSFLINIVNIKNTKLLESGKWFFIAEKDGIYQFITISAECGYKLQNVDKVYRYGRDVYAYIVTFSVKNSIEILSDIEKNRKNKLNLTFVQNENSALVCMMHTSYVMRNRGNAGRNILVESNNAKTFIKKAMFVILKKAIDFTYHILEKIRKKDGYHILLLSETRVPMGGNLKALDDRLKERQLDKVYKISYSFSKTLQQSKWKTLKEWLRLIWLTAKQDLIFVDDYVPIFKTIHLSKKTKLIQLWHAGVGFKSVGYSRFGREGSPLPLDSCHRQYDYAIVGGEGLRRVYEEVFGIPIERILPYGLSRLDGYMDPERAEKYKIDFYRRYPKLKEKKIILFAPTYRGKTQAEAYYPYEWIEHEKIMEMCGNEYVFVYKMHPFITQHVTIESDYEEVIFDLSEEKDINKLFYVTDILITDFSSNIYEFSLHRKPIIFFAPDMDFYQLTRGVHQKLTNAPGVVCESIDEVIKTIKIQQFDLEKIDRFVANSFDVHSSYSSDLLIDNLIIRKGNTN